MKIRNNIALRITFLQTKVKQKTTLLKGLFTICNNSEKERYGKWCHSGSYFPLSVLQKSTLSALYHFASCNRFPMYVNRQSAKGSQQDVKLCPMPLAKGKVSIDQPTKEIVDCLLVLGRQVSALRQGSDAVSAVGLGRPPGVDENMLQPNIVSFSRFNGKKSILSPENRAHEMFYYKMPVEATSFLKRLLEMQESLNTIVKYSDANPMAQLYPQDIAFGTITLSSSEHFASSRKQDRTKKQNGTLGEISESNINSNIAFTSKTNPPPTDLNSYQDAHNFSSTNYARVQRVLKGFDFSNREKLKLCAHSTYKSVHYEKTTLLSHLFDLGSSTSVHEKLYSGTVSNGGLKNRSSCFREVGSDSQDAIAPLSLYLNYKSVFKESFHTQKHCSLSSISNPITFLHSLSPTIHPLSNGMNDHEFLVYPCQRNNTQENLDMQEESEAVPVQVSENHLPLEQSDADASLTINPEDHQFSVAQEELRK